MTEHAPERVALTGAEVSRLHRAMPPEYDRAVVVGVVERIIAARIDDVIGDAYSIGFQNGVRSTEPSEWISQQIAAAKAEAWDEALAYASSHITGDGAVHRGWIAGWLTDQEAANPYRIRADASGTPTRPNED